MMRFVASYSFAVYVGSLFAVPERVCQADLKQSLIQLVRVAESNMGF
jgi:hypothetical protein